MTKKSQKEAVVDLVISTLPNFLKNQDNAISMLSAVQLESIKNQMYDGIINGQIEYGKDITLISEVRAYSRSVVMNHLKKAKELNGGTSTIKKNSTNTNASPFMKVKEEQQVIAPRGVKVDILPEDLRDYAASLV